MTKVVHVGDKKFKAPRTEHGRAADSAALHLWLRKDVRKIINRMPLDEQKEWLQRAGIECNGYDAKHLGPLILGRVM